METEVNTPTEKDLPLPEKELPAQASKKSLLSLKWPFIVGGLFVILALFGGAFYLGKNSSNKINPVPSAAPDIYSPKPTDETANWKTYTGKNFSFKYPQGLIAENGQLSVSKSDPESQADYGFILGYSYFQNPLPHFSFDDAVGTKKEVGDRIYQTIIEKTKIDNKKAIKVQQQVLPGSQSDSQSGETIFVDLEANSYGSIELSNNGDEILKKYGTSVSKILSTFKFTNPDDNSSQIFSDPQIGNLKIKYDPKKWIASAEDLKACSGAGCGAPSGRVFYFKDLIYGDNLMLVINLFKNSQYNTLANPQKICFGPEDIQNIGNGWYRARNPFYTQVTDDTNRSWGKYFYSQEDLTTEGEKKCIMGSLNLYKSTPKGATYEGEHTGMSIELRNSISKNKSNSLDQVVRGIEFTE